MIRNCHWLVASLVVTVWAGAAQAQTTSSITGSSAAMKSTGSNKLSDIGYVGSYITVPAGGATINFTVNATEGSGKGNGPHLNVVVADTTLGMTVGSTKATNYNTDSVTLPAGTYVVRVERDYDNNATSSRAATVNNLTVSTLSGGAVKFSNTNSDANALAASNTYIQNFRQGNVSIAMNGVAPGTPVEVHMTRNAFNFGTAVAGAGPVWNSPLYAGNTDPTQAAYLQHLTAQVPGTYVNYFNTIVPENAGKWDYQEAGPMKPVAPTVGYVDNIIEFASASNLDVRMHALLWDYSAQQPDWIDKLIASAKKGNAKAKSDLSAAIINRMQYYVRNFATQYSELDVLNEALHTGSYWKIFGAAGIANIYNQVAATAAAGGNAGMRLFTNEYNVLQHSTDPSSKKSDPYANWYSKNEIEAIRNAGGALSGIGMQYYVDSKATGSSAHSAARIMQVLQNLSTNGLPISLNEFAVQNGSKALANAPKYLEETMRLMYGNPEATDFLTWGFWQGNMLSSANASALWDANWNLTPTGAKWAELMGDWSTTLDDLVVGADGKIDFTGYYGDYDIIVGDQHYDLSLLKGIDDYSLDAISPLNVPVVNEPDHDLNAFAFDSFELLEVSAAPEPSGLSLAVVAAAAGMWAIRRRACRARQ